MREPDVRNHLGADVRERHRRSAQRQRLVFGWIGRQELIEHAIGTVRHGLHARQQLGRFRGGNVPPRQLGCQRHVMELAANVMPQPGESDLPQLLGRDVLDRPDQMHRGVVVHVRSAS